MVGVMIVVRIASWYVGRRRMVEIAIFARLSLGFSVVS